MMGIGLGPILRPCGSGSSPPIDPAIAWTGKYDTVAGHFTTGSGHVTEWTDQSGNGRHFTPDVATHGPVVSGTTPNGKSAFDFDGSTEYLESAAAKSAFISASAYTMFVVLRLDGAALNVGNSWSNNTIVGDTDEWLELLAAKNATTLYTANFAAADDHADTTITNGTWYVIETRHEGGTIYLRVNGGAEVSASSGDTGDLSSVLRLALGATGGYADCALAAFRLTNIALTLSDRDAVGAFLKYDNGIP